MKKSRWSEEQIIKILQEAEQSDHEVRTEVTVRQDDVPPMRHESTWLPSEHPVMPLTRREPAAVPR